MRILLVEDETVIARTVLYALEAEGFAGEHALSGGEALAKADAGRFDLAILDVGLPDIDGFALCRELRRRGDLPVIFLTARAAEPERMLGFELGADDYLAKPFSPRELVARVKAVLRRTGSAGTRDADAGSTSAAAAQASAPAAQAAAATLATTGDFGHDAEGHRIHYRGRPLPLTRYEYGLLAALLQRPGAILTRAQLLDRVWGHDSDTGDRSVDTHIKTLRAKLREIAPDADPIRTERGIGYSLQPG